MSEENTTQETTEQSQPALDLDSTVKVDGEEVSVRDLITARDEAVQLKEYNEHAKTLISPKGSDDLSRENAVRYLMTQEGYTPQDIEEYITWTNQPPEPQEESVEMQPDPELFKPQAEENYDPDQLLLQQQQEQYRMQQEQLMQEQEQQRLNQIEDRQQRLGAEMMKKELNNALNNTISTDENIKKLMGLESGGENRQEVLRHEVEAAMLESLRNRRAAGENFNPAWFTEEAGKAAQTVYDKFRSVIGDPDKIQRSPETVTDSDSLFNKPPVNPHKYEKGDDMGTINVKTREWTLDTLLRGAQEGATGGESKA